jgi:hypothetical protein
MIYLALNSNIVVGPVAWNNPAIRQTLYIAGFSESVAGLHAPDGTALPALPATEPTTALTLADGYAILPEVVEPSNPPVGDVQTGTTTTVANGVVTVAPVYGAAPAPPPAAPQTAYVSKIDFNNRFQASERQAVLLAIRNGDVVLEDANNTLSLTTDPPGVNLNDTNLQTWANYLVNDVKILTAERANAILAGSSFTISASTAATASNASTTSSTTGS